MDRRHIDDREVVETAKFGQCRNDDMFFRSKIVMQYLGIDGFSTSTTVNVPSPAGKATACGDWYAKFYSHDH